MYELLQIHRRNMNTLEELEKEHLKKTSSLEHLQMNNSRLKVWIAGHESVCSQNHPRKTDVMYIIINNRVASWLWWQQIDKQFNSITVLYFFCSYMWVIWLHYVNGFNFWASLKKPELSCHSKKSCERFRTCFSFDWTFVYAKVLRCCSTDFNNNIFFQSRISWSCLWERSQVYMRLRGSCNSKLRLCRAA